MSELEELKKKLYWICEDCGYEVDFNENEQNEICPSCGAPAPRHAIQEARSALEQYKKAVIEQQEAERLRQLELFKAEQRAKRNERIAKTFHVIPYAYIFILIAALALTVVDIASKNMDVSALWDNTVSIMSSTAAGRGVPGIRESGRKAAEDHCGCRAGGGGRGRPNGRRTVFPHRPGQDGLRYGFRRRTGRRGDQNRHGRARGLSRRH